MSNPERFCLDGPTGTPQELMVTRYYEGTDGQREVTVPRPHDVAEALSRCSDEWFKEFLRAFQAKSPNRATGVAHIAALEDVAGGDCDPGFGVDPNDSAHLLQLRQAIDAIGWSSQADEERGDYLGRLKEIREELGAQDTVRGQVIRQQQKLARQRKELRRLNAAERARSLAVSLAHHQHAVYVDPQAEQRRIAHLVWSVAQLLEKHPTHFTDRSVAELREALSTWHQRLVAP